ncbi:methionyl-tRNA formyltransferase [soil metagenome]
MRLIFMGTPDFAVPTLEALCAAGHDIAAVYTRPPKQAGRGLAERPSPVHRFASAHQIEVRCPRSLKSEADQAAFGDLKAHAAIVVAYGLLLPPAILSAPRLGCFNVHASLLPRWRGAAPIQRAIMAGDAATGISIMRMSAGLDEGPVCLAAAVSISPETTAGVLHDQLAAGGARLAVEAVNALANGSLTCKEQPEDGVTYARKIDKAETHIDIAQSAAAVRNHIHGLSPFPGAWCRINGQRIKILRCETTPDSGPPGTVLDDCLTIACGVGALRLLILQREGKGPLDAAAFLRGFPAPQGTGVS